MIPLPHCLVAVGWVGTRADSGLPSPSLVDNLYNRGYQPFDLDVSFLRFRKLRQILASPFIMRPLLIRSDSRFNHQLCIVNNQAIGDSRAKFLVFSKERAGRAHPLEIICNVEPLVTRSYLCIHRSKAGRANEIISGHSSFLLSSLSMS